jgi:hypothetical protein
MFFGSDYKLVIKKKQEFMDKWECCCYNFALLYVIFFLFPTSLHNFPWSQDMSQYYNSSSYHFVIWHLRFDSDIYS